MIMTIQSNKYVLKKVKTRSNAVFLGLAIIGLFSVIIMMTLFDWNHLFGRNIFKHLVFIYALIISINGFRQQIAEDRRTIISIEVNNEKITFTSFGFRPKTVTYNSSELKSNYNKHELRNNMEISEITYNNELAFYYFPSLFDNEELLKSSNSFVKKLINLK